MKKVHTSLDIILSKITYNEILKGDIFNYDAFEHYKDSIIQLQDGSVMVVFKFETANDNFSSNNIANKSDLLLTYFSNLEDGFEINFEARRRKVCLQYISFSQYLSGSLKEIEEKRENEFTSTDNLINEIYITLIYKNINKNLSLTSQNLTTLIEKANELKDAILSLSCIPILLKSSNLISFLKYAYDFTTDKILDFNIDKTLSSALLTSSYKLKNIPLVIDTGTKNYVNCLTFTSLPAESEADMFSFLFSMPFEFRMVLKYKAHSREKAKNIIAHKKKSYKNSLFSLTSYMKKEVANSDISDEFSYDAMNGKAQCDAALETLSVSNMSAGDVQLTFVLHSNDTDILDSNIDIFKTIMRKKGFLIKSEGIGNTLCFISTMPGCCSYYNPLFVLSKNFCDFLHLSSPWQGSKNSKLLSKRTGSNAPLIYARNLDTSPFYFTLAGENGEKGHTFITGPTGSGKSALLSLIAASFLKFNNTRCIIIDRDLSSLKLVLDNNGKIFYPGKDKTCFNITSSSKTNKRKIFEFMKAVCFISNITYTTSMQDVISKAISIIDEDSTTLSEFYSILAGLDSSSLLLTALHPFIKEGEYGGLFDAKENTFDIKNRLTLIETNKILQNSSNDKNVSIVFFIYLFMHLDELFSDCIPTLLIIDEGWKVIKNKVFAQFFEEWIKTLRKKNVDIVFSLTNLSDIIDTQIAETIISNTETKIFFNDISAENEIQKLNYQKAGLSSHEINLIRRSPRFCPLVIQDNKLSIVDFRMQNILNLITTSPETKKNFCA